MGVRYHRQGSHQINCGPVAILNALRWTGHPARKEHLRYLEFACRTFNIYDPGTTDHDFDRVLRYVLESKTEIHRSKNPRYKKLVDHLESGGIALIGYPYHFSMIEKKEGEMFLMVNDGTSAYDKRTKAYKRKSTIKKILKLRGTTVWFLTLRKPAQTT